MVSLIMHLKKAHIQVIYLLLFLLFSGVSCKYEDGPDISLRSAESRVRGTYEINKFEVGGIDFTNSIKAQTCYRPITFDWDNVADQGVFYMNRDQVTCESNGVWSLTNKNTTIIMGFYGNFIGFPPFGSGGGTEYEILELRNKEMKFRCIYNNVTYIIELSE
jgi:hypothetical protein